LLINTAVYKKNKTGSTAGGDVVSSQQQKVAIQCLVL